MLDGFLPLRGQQRRHVADGQHDVHLGRMERAHRGGGLLGVGRGEQFVRDDRRFPRLLGLAGQDLPFAGPGPRRVGGQLLDAAQVLAGPEMVLGMVPGQHDALGGQFGAVAPQHLLDKGRAGLRLPDVQEDPGLSVLGAANRYTPPILGDGAADQARWPAAATSRANQHTSYRRRRGAQCCTGLPAHKPAHSRQAAYALQACLGATCAGPARCSAHFISKGRRVLLMHEPFSLLVPVYDGDRPDYLRRAFRSAVHDQTVRAGPGDHRSGRAGAGGACRVPR